MGSPCLQQKIDFISNMVEMETLPFNNKQTSILRFYQSWVKPFISAVSYSTHFQPPKGTPMMLSLATY